MYYSASSKFSILYFKTQYDTVILGAFQFDFGKENSHARDTCFMPCKTTLMFC